MAGLTYVNEAEFFHAFLSTELREVPAGALVIEVGSGMGLLSMMVADEGFRVVSYEPASAGFVRMRQLRSIALRHWTGTRGEVMWRDCDLERHCGPTPGDVAFAYAINVIEHVPRYGDLIDDAIAHLRPTGFMSVVCPNYMYPYESHFHMPTLWSKSLTGWAMRNRIGRAPIESPWDFFADLSWPTGPRIASTVRARGLQTTFSPRATLAYLARAENDLVFRDRKGGLPTSRPALRAARWAATHMPAWALPVLDCRVTRVR